MIAKAKKQKKGRLKEDTVLQLIFFILTLFFIGILSFSQLKIIKKRAELQEKIRSLEEEIQYLEEKREGLETGISQTEKESYWEEKAREQGYIKEGESPVVVLPPEDAQNGENLLEQNSPESFWEKLKNFFARVIQW
jgi:cell division protein FtsB